MIKGLCGALGGIRFVDKCLFYKLKATSALQKPFYHQVPT